MGGIENINNKLSETSETFRRIKVEDYNFIIFNQHLVLKIIHSEQ